MAQTSFSNGFSQPKIADQAGFNHSTVGEHKTFLTKSAKLLRETEDDGLTLVADAKPDWWRKGEELLAEFPHPDQVLGWWTENNAGSTPESARHARHPQEESQNPDTYAKSGVGQPNRHPCAATHHPQHSTPLEDVTGGKTAMADEVPATEKGLSRPEGRVSETAASVAGGFENVGLKPCGHGYLSGTGCYLCYPNHPYRLKEGVKA